MWKLTKASEPPVFLKVGNFLLGSIAVSLVYFLLPVWLQEEAVEEVGFPEEAFEGAGAVH